MTPLAYEAVECTEEDSTTNNSVSAATLNYPDSDFLKTLGLSEYELGFAELEFGRGLTYYLNRVDRIHFSGERVLDAGCGVGQWALALSHRFKHVDALDLKGDRLETFKMVVERLGIDNIDVQQGSVTDLPYEDNSFDAIFCYGVIMFTPIRDTLREFFRVLKPGGRVYVCLNGDGWYQYLLETREDEATQKYMRHILSHYGMVRLLPGVDPRQYSFLLTAYQELQSLVAKLGKSFWKGYLKIPARESLFVKLLASKPALKKCLEQAIQTHGRIGPVYFAGKLLDKLKAEGRQFTLRSLVAVFVEIRPEWVLHATTQATDVKSLAKVICGLLEDFDLNREADPTKAYGYEEFGSLLADAGFTRHQFAWEGHLVCNTTVPAVKPMYEGNYKGKLGVWEALFVKPMVKPDWMTVEEHLESARQVRHNRYWLSDSQGAVLSNAPASESYPFALLDRAYHRAELLGGERHLAFLAETLCQGVDDEESRFCKIVRFVQDAIFRDPVSQPLTREGVLPDPVAILMTHIGRCGHVAKVLVAMLQCVNIQAEIIQLHRHVSVKALINGDWVLADADVFKNGVIPLNKQGKLLTMADIQDNPYLVDCYPATGWAIMPESLYNRDIWGQRVFGYTDALSFEDRGFLSGYFDPRAAGYPPSLPVISRFVAQGDEFILEWSPSTIKSDDVIGYRVAVGTTSRNWSYLDLGTDADAVCRATAQDILAEETSACKVTGQLPLSGVAKLYAAVTAVSQKRLEQESGTYFWPSEEATCELA